MNSIIIVCHSIANTIDRFNDWIGKSIAWLTLIMVLTTFLIVVLRYVFDLGWIAMQESVFYMHALVFMLGIGFTLKHEKHVRVDIIYQRLEEKAQAWIDFFGTIILLMPFCVYILWSSWGYVEASWAIQEGSREAGGLPGLYLIKATIPVMAGLLLLQGLALALRSFVTALGRPGIDRQ